MAKQTVLQIVQDILNDMDSDTVNSIDDTIEATQIANIVRSTYLDMITTRYWPHLEVLTQLVASGDSAKPTHMTMADEIQKVLKIKYDKQVSGDTRTRFQDVYWKEPDEFLDLVMARDSSASNILTVTDDGGTPLYIIDDKAPTYWTTFDGETIIFDSYDSVVDTTLQASKTQVRVYKEPSFTVSDAHTPDLPAKSFQLLVEEAKAAAFEDIKQTRSMKHETRARKQSQWHAREKFRLNGGLKRGNYGRK